MKMLSWFSFYSGKARWILIVSFKNVGPNAEEFGNFTRVYNIKKWKKDKATVFNRGSQKSKANLKTNKNNKSRKGNKTQFSKGISSSDVGSSPICLERLFLRWDATSEKASPLSPPSLWFWEGPQKCQELISKTGSVQMEKLIF